MALPAGRYGVTKNQLLKIKKLPMNTIKLIEELTEKFDLLGTAAFKNSTSVVTSSSDLVESEAVKDIVGWGNKNLFNKNAVENGVIGESGTIVIIGEWKSSEFIKVTPSEKYIISGLNVSYSSSAGFAFYNSAKTFVSGGGINVFKNTPITIPDNVEYIRFSLVSADLDTAQLEVGSTATSYEPYHASVEESKADNSVIGTVEGANASKAWSVGEHFISGGQFKEVTQPISSGGTISDSNTVDKPIAEYFTPLIDYISKNGLSIYCVKYGKIVILGIADGSNTNAYSNGDIVVQLNEFSIFNNTDKFKVDTYARENYGGTARFIASSGSNNIIVRSDVPANTIIRVSLIGILM